MSLYYPRSVIVGDHAFVVGEMIRNKIHKVNISTGYTLKAFAAAPVSPGAGSGDLTISDWKDGFVVGVGTDYAYYNNNDNTWTALSSVPYNTRINPMVVDGRLYIFSSYDGAFYEYLP